MNIKTANRLCELRKAHNLSQEELAEKLGVSRQAVSKWERSESSPDTDNLIQLAALYNISLDELLNGKEAISLIEESPKVVDEIKVVEISEHIKVSIDGDEAKVIYDDDEEEILSLKETLKWNEKIRVVENTIMSFSGVLFPALYVLLGVLFAGWAKYWFLFILVPVPTEIVKTICRKNVNYFPLEIIVVATYCALGMNFGLWHPLWVLFFIIPCFRVLTGILVKKKNSKQHIVDAYNQIIEE
jgi:transcriptional regulator with XRE-family HTH domain